MSKDLFLRGCFNNWQADSDYKFIETEIDNKLSLIVELPEGQYECKIGDADWTEDYGLFSDEPFLQEKDVKFLTEKGENIKLDLAEGVYKFIFDVNNKSIEFHKGTSHKQETFNKLRGIKSLLHEAIDAGVTAVEHIHKSIANIPFEAMEKVEPLESSVKGIKNVHNTTTHNVYNMIRSVNKIISEVGENLIKIIEKE
ncbi:MAG: hypothetical protein HQK79_14640 [Desulfobacterales bacterium]|nr:hypothetical protein [Desulfobacterales bacterium]MBF0398799.1 hypothetical protein [Desulfobacterales bacterium]